MRYLYFALMLLQLVQSCEQHRVRYGGPSLTLCTKNTRDDLLRKLFSFAAIRKLSY